MPIADLYGVIAVLHQSKFSQKRQEFLDKDWDFFYKDNDICFKE